MEKDRSKMTEDIQNCSYRDLQLLTKHYGLPSNYKKIHLIQLIVAKRMGLEESVKKIIEEVRKERQEMKKSKTRRRKLQTQQTFSPPISATPKLKLVQNTTQKHVSKYNTRRSLLASLMNDESPKNLDANKFLKQYDNRSMRNVQSQTKHLLGEQIHKVKLTSQCIMKRQASADIIMRKDNIEVVYSTSATQSMSAVPAKRQRILSGIYPINQNPIVKLQRGDLTLRRNDGTVSKINAFVQDKPPKASEIIRDVLQDLETNNYENNLLHRNMSIDSAFCEANTSIETHDGMEILYYENRVEHTKYETYKENRLPKIADVFSKFNERDYSQQLVQVSAESDEYPYSSCIPQTITQTLENQLETLYNFKSLFTDSSFLQISSKSKTICTNSTKTVMSTKVYPTSTVISHNAYPRYDGNYTNDQHVEFLYCTEPLLQPDNSHYLNNNTAEFSGSSSYDRSPLVGANITIPEMVEDALEVISQDKDYMKHVDMDAKINCVLCAWSGPVIVIDYHIQKNHANEIMKQVTNDWNITFTLEALVQEPLWCSRVLEYESVLYVLSTKYEEPDVFIATLTSLSTDLAFKTGSVTIFNKVTGEPFTWEGEIKCLQPDWPYPKNLNGLKINLSKLDLLPQIYPIAGQSGLKDIHIILFARLYN